MRRAQFTIRSLMIAVMIVAFALGLLKRWPEGLLVTVLLGGPLFVLSVLFGKVPRRRSARRFGMSVAMLSLILLGTGWLTARLLIWFFQWKYGSVAHYGTWGWVNFPALCLAVPAVMTAVGLFLNMVVLADMCVSRRRFGLLLVVAAFALALAAGWIGLFGLLASESFR
jgi:hypothetical protein